ncbi:TRAP transporter small permease subunit [Aquicoccus sp. G2-2]|uniref:TRAP transporter small permease subunit n=1 Tax=Aquicoccus sp. G2-2 TaxID=3092120 RepID=UPI002ADFAF80|nr:TRAP transporter small permease subunit [Aquicoccus sp. G2-2]MEA1114454.1 TRAP transporter small permease subunit [Aquicoccus sp. G2-2]
MTESSSRAAMAAGEPAILVRIIGWAMLGALVAFLVNNVLSVGFGFSGPLAIFKDGANFGQGAVQVGLFAVALLLAILLVLGTRETTLRLDAARVHRFNVYLIRALFWAVLFVGVTDVFIAFMRVESGFDSFLSETMVQHFSSPRWVGHYIHIPLIVIAFIVAGFTRTLGFHWLAILIVMAELTIVISRFVFSYEQALMADLVRYWYAALFLFASAYTLFDDGHVRVDVLYAGFGNTTRGKVNAFGAILLGMTTAWVILYIGFNGKQSIINSPVLNFEVTQSGNSGMFVKYQMAAFLGIFAATMLIEFVSFFFEAVANWRDEPGARAFEPVAH